MVVIFIAFVFMAFVVMSVILMVFVVMMRVCVGLLLVMKQRSAWNVEIVELRVLLGKADI
jgi:hypothetical protein